MSVVLASSLVIPKNFHNMQVEKNLHWNFCQDQIALQSAALIPFKNENMVEVEDLRVLRSLSRAGLILYRVAKECVESFGSSFLKDPIRTGLYCGVDQGPMDYNLVEEISKSEDSEMGSILLRYTKPKQLFKMYPNYSTNQVGIMLGIEGPMQTFTNMHFGSFHALEQAEFDLWRGVIDFALVCSANSLEDPMVGKRLELQAPLNSTLSEGGAAIILAKSSERTKWENYKEKSDELFYGIANPLIKVVSNKK